MTATWNPLTWRLSLSNFDYVFARTAVPRYMLNSLVVVLLMLTGQLLLAFPAAFALARYSFAGKRLLMSVIIAAIAFPGFVAAVPNYLLLARLNLLDSVAGLVLPFWATAFGAFLFRQALAGIPQDYFDAAVIDGCSITRIMTSVAAPLVTPHLVTFVVFSIATHWNELFWPLVVIRSSRKFTATAGVMFFANSELGTEWGPLSAAALIVVVPMIALFIGVADRLNEGLSATALK
ncbi:MAG: carbohydrate ABC transporter permease [Spirochaetaceae bacterium]